MLQCNFSDFNFIHLSLPTKMCFVAFYAYFKSNKDKLLALIERFPQEMPKVGLVHPFFGAMPLEQWGEGAYKHLDYHLGQFGA